MKFNENPASGSRVFLCEKTDRQTGRHDEPNSHFSQFCKRAYKSAVKKETPLWQSKDSEIISDVNTAPTPKMRIYCRENFRNLKQGKKNNAWIRF
jgi:hypothetical protein